MIFGKLGLINKNQWGFTLLELLIALAITGIITGGIITTIFQVFNTNIRSSNHMVAVRQVQNAGYWLSRDAQMAQIVELAEDENPEGTGFPLTLTWVDWDTNEEHEVVYSLLAVNEFQRSHSVNSGSQTQTIVAKCINPDPAMTNCKFIDTNGDGTSDRLVFKVTATVSKESETREYEVSPRPIMY